MKREARLLLNKACDGLVLAIELYNRPSDRGRVTATLVQMDHSFEMLLKASIVHRGALIRHRSQPGQTIGFDACVRKGMSNGSIKFLTEEQAILLRAINDLRDAAQHYIIHISESQLYIHIQSGVTLFRDILTLVFDRDLTGIMPARVLPISTEPPVDLLPLFETEVHQIQKLLLPGRRRRLEAMARLRALAILDTALLGGSGQPTERELEDISSRLRDRNGWTDVFKGVSTVNLSRTGEGPTLALRISKRDGSPIRIVGEESGEAAAIVMRTVADQDYYNLGARALSGHVGLTEPKTLAVIHHLGLRDDPEYYKEFRFGRSVHKRFSHKAIAAIKECASKESLQDIWAVYQKARLKKR